MIDPATAKEGAALISSAIAELLEDAAAEAAMVSEAPSLMAKRAQMLRTVGEETIVLSDALRVFANRAEAL